MGLEPTSRRATTCFQDRLLIRPDDFRPLNQAPGVGIEPTASWFRARRHYQQQLPRIVLVSMTTSCLHGSHRAAGAGIEPAASWFKAKRHYQQRLPRIGKSALRESNPPRQVGSLEPLPLGQGHVKAEGEGVEPSRLVRSTAFEAAAIANWLALPLLKAPAGGIEPPVVSLTGSCLTVGPHRIM